MLLLEFTGVFCSFKSMRKLYIEEVGPPGYDHSFLSSNSSFFLLIFSLLLFLGFHIYLYKTLDSTQVSVLTKRLWRPSPVSKQAHGPMAWQPTASPTSTLAMPINVPTSCSLLLAQVKVLHPSPIPMPQP